MRTIGGLCVGLVVGMVGAAFAGCGDSGQSVFPTDAQADGDLDASAGDADQTFNETGTPDTGPLTCAAGCPAGLVCVRNACLPPQGACTSNAGCNYDTYCDATGTCVPYGSAPDNKPNDSTCTQLIAAGSFAPQIKCDFRVPALDAFPNHVDVQATPAVVNFNQGPAGPTGPPSIIAPFTQPVANSYTETFGILRVLKGTDCTLEANIAGVDLDADSQIDWVRSSSPVAVGDLDGDHVAEIVAYMADSSTIAFTRKAGVWAPLWPKVKATLADGVTIYIAPTPSAWAGPSIHDLDDDGIPEIIREGAVINGRTGKLVTSNPANYATYSVGIPPVLSNIDGIADVELMTGAHRWKFDPLGKTWASNAAYDTITTAPGWTAVADFNPYDLLKLPEIAVAANSTLSVYNLDHTTFMGMSALPVPGTGGGPPTIADYDGDGLPEVGLAGKDYYTVFDPDCQATPRPGGKCADRTHCDFAAATGDAGAGACPDFVLWSRKTQDHSSDITGSSVFDFEADGKAEVIYADECFTRIYSGLDGKVLFSQYRSSCTWLENPVVADVDGDFRAELVVPSNTACGPIGVGTSCGGLDTNGVDSQFTGLICAKNSDCVSGACDSGYCRCTTSSQCCAGGGMGGADAGADAGDAGADTACVDFGFQCAPPPAGTPGAGNTCRASHPNGLQGIRVYKDSANRWVRSRTIWNQHAYAVTNVGEDGTVPKTSAWGVNWTSSGLNNFRQNVPGVPDGKSVGDLTAPVAQNFQCVSGSAIMSILVCNRGTAPVSGGIPVGFYVGAGQVCTSATAGTIDVGKCETVSCTWTNPPASASTEVDVSVVPNDGGQTPECDTTNNKGLVRNVFCVPVK